MVVDEIKKIRRESHSNVELQHLRVYFRQLQIVHSLIETLVLIHQLISCYFVYLNKKVNGDGEW